MIRPLMRKVLGSRRVHSLRTLVRDSSIYTQQATICEPGAGSVVVLAPHMDDETLGCGGTIARHVRAGADVTVVFLTDGRHGGASYVGLPESERERSQSRLVEIRKEEARSAARILGVGSLHFLDAEDGKLRDNTQVPRLLRAILQRVRPLCVYVPFFLERH